MALSFPINPNLGDSYTFGGKTWTWNGFAWAASLPIGEIVGNISSNTLNLSSGSVFSDNPASSLTYVFSELPESVTAYGFTLQITPSANIAITWPTSVKWAGGTAPDAPAMSETDVFTFYTKDNGVTYYGFQSGNAMS
jgi:hypothetical protein